VALRWAGGGSSSNDFEQGEIGADLFRQACKFGLAGLVSKRRESTYRAGRSPHWIKVKNRSHPALDRVKESFWWVTTKTPLTCGGNGPKSLASMLMIDGDIHYPVMELSPEDRRNREKVNEAVRRYRERD
jgi:hypothetical protein